MRVVIAWLRLHALSSLLLAATFACRSIVITPDPGQEDTVLNVDGEAFAGPGPFRIHVLPSLLVAYGTY